MESLETTQLMPIGRFARLTGLTVKALRHYDELGLLRPASVDRETGYRSYAAEQVGRAEAIRTLRRLELPLDDIATLLVDRRPGGGAPAARRPPAPDGDSLGGAEGRPPGPATADRRKGHRDGNTKRRRSTARAHRRLGVDLFNKTWTLMEKDERTAEEDDEMLHCAHASAYHWLQVGTAANRARSEWQCSRVYTVLGRAEPALHHAQRCLEICEAEPDALEDWDLPFAYEALARAHAVAGDTAEARRYLELGARRSAQRSPTTTTARLLETDLATIGT